MDDYEKTHDVCADRINAIFAAAKKDTDAIVIYNGTEPHLDPNFFYVTDFIHGGVFEGSTAIIFADGSAEIVVPELEEASARSAASMRQTISTYTTKDEYEDALRESLDGVDAVGLNLAGIAHGSFLKLKKLMPRKKFIDVGGAFEKVRLVKDGAELAYIRKACTITTQAFGDALDKITEGMHEYELAAEISYAMRRRGATGDSFAPIVAFGKNSALPHHGTGNTKLKQDDFILMDVGCTYNRYCSDFTRTVVFGKATAGQKQLYGTVKEAQKIGLDAMRAGVDANEVHNTVEKYIDEAHGGKYKGRFIHSAGHSIGLSVHDGASLKNTKKKLILEENMVFTMEPGIYVPNVGGVRIEDSVVVKKGKVDVLTKAGKELIEL